MCTSQGFHGVALRLCDAHLAPDFSLGAHPSDIAGVCDPWSESFPRLQVERFPVDRACVGLDGDGGGAERVQLRVRLARAATSWVQC